MDKRARVINKGLPPPLFFFLESLLFDNNYCVFPTLVLPYILGVLLDVTLVLVLRLGCRAQHGGPGPKSDHRGYLTRTSSSSQSSPNHDHFPRSQ